MSARKTALKALIACRRQGAWSDGALKELLAQDRLSERDAALATRLCYGVLQNRMLLDFYVDAFLSTPRSKLQPITEDILRLGAYQLTMMDRIPASAAVNESVELAKQYVNPGAARLVNGLLRSMSRAEQLPEPDSLAVRYSHPQSLVDLLAAELPQEELPALLAAHNETQPICVQVNPLRADAQQIREELEARGARFTPHPWLEGCFTLSGAGNLEQLDLFREGKLFVQDAAAHLAALAGELEPGMQILDCCAAPGGKSFAAAIQAKDQASITSCDIHPHKIRLIEAGAKRLCLGSIHAMVQDASKRREDWLEAFDLVIADVPCSGLGVIRKKPDIRYKDLSAIGRLPQVQRAILEVQAGYVRPGGQLVYSTCTVLRRENEDVVRAFLDEHPEFHLEPVPVPQGLDAPNEGMLTLWPHRHGTDGFFISRMRKRA